MHYTVYAFLATIMIMIIMIMIMIIIIIISGALWVRKFGKLSTEKIWL